MNTNHRFEFLNIENEFIEYYTNYKNALCQFIIRNGTYNGGVKLKKRERINTEQMTKLLKEIQEIEVFIYKLKYEKQV